MTVSRRGIPGSVRVLLAVLGVAPLACDSAAQDGLGGRRESSADDGRATTDAGRAADAARATADGGTADPGSQGGHDSATVVAAHEPYQLCDGSDQVRLAVNSGGGAVDSTYAFTNPYGLQFLYVTGKCNFVASPTFRYLDGWTEGTLTPDQAAALSAGLGLDGLSGLLFTDTQSCPDAGLVSLATTEGYADCSCGCDAAAPPAVGAALRGLDGAYALLEQAGRPVSGPMALLAVTAPDEVKRPGAKVLSWPLTWPLSSIAVSYDVVHQLFPLGGPLAKAPYVAQAEEADAVRRLRAEWLTSDPYGSTIVVEQAGKLYWLYPRDQLAPELATAIDTFRKTVDLTVAATRARP